MQYKKLGILGGGQLGRMSAQAATAMGIETVIFTPEKDSPASQVVKETMVASYDDQEQLKEFAGKVDVISYEFENVPCETIRYLEKLKPVYTDSNLLEIAQDRIREKTFLNSIGIETARFESAENQENVDKILKSWGKPQCIIKTTRFGYDGKGQIFYDLDKNPDEAFLKLPSGPLIVEEIIDFDCEISVIVGRDFKGDMATYGPMLNEHRHHILHKTTIPASIRNELSRKAVEVTEKLAQAVNLRGVLALEMFVTKDGRILANEIAPRTHNSGHWSMDACDISQFAQHVRTVCGFAAQQPVRHSDAVMLNLIGDDVLQADDYRKKKNACVHLYGKHDIKPGRKMGHVTFLNKKTD
ncbi:MAG: 5-(carboxyamino)imidazole ribonucleotide synthase [Alphaproteobacteria bacterium]|nr:5-(carboxyamino)imidazole ribonucleotide synthase [Alphaproteobacteria bacterium]